MGATEAYISMRCISSTNIYPTVVLADDNATILEHVSRILTPGYSVVAKVMNGQSAVEAVIKFNPEIALLDISMPELDGFAVARIIKGNNVCQTKIIFLTLYDDVEFIAEALRTGALGYVIKSAVHSDLIPAVENVLSGRVFVSSCLF